MNHEIEWNKLMVLSKLTDAGKEQFNNMTLEKQMSLIYGAMVSDLFNFPIIQA